MTCAKLVPKPIVDKHLAELPFQPETGRDRSSHSLACEFQRQTPFAEVRILFTCDMTEFTRRQREIEPGKNEVKGVGRMAAAGESMFTFWATNAQCVVDIIFGGETPVAKDQVPLAKDLDAALTPASFK